MGAEQICAAKAGVEKSRFFFLTQRRKAAMNLHEFKMR
jgi:hypothetical protein